MHRFPTKSQDLGQHLHQPQCCCFGALRITCLGHKLYSPKRDQVVLVRRQEGTIEDAGLVQGCLAPITDLTRSSTDRHKTMAYSVPTTPDEEPPETQEVGTQLWPLWEVFVRPQRGMSHVHAGSLHAPDPETALQNARDVYTRREEGVSVWVIPSAWMFCSDPDQTESWFDTNRHPFRHPTYFRIPEEVQWM